MDYQGSNVRHFLHANGHVVLERVENNCNLRSFTQKEIEDITSGYSTVLGEGGFGEVYKGKLDDRRPVAVKRYKNGTNKEKFAKEVIVHSQINHKNIVRLLGCCTEVNSLTIVMEFVCNGNLHNILHCSSANGSIPFPLDKRLDIAVESAEVLSCMHSMYSPVLHGDIKPANILLDENLRPKISDFGIARLLVADEIRHTGYVIGSIGYMDPLFAQSGILTPKSDVYSFGVVLLEIITRKEPVDGSSERFSEAMSKGKKIRKMFDEEIANDKKNLKFLEDVAKVADECLKMEDKMRPGMIEVANRLRTIRKAYHQGMGRNSKGSNSGLTKGGKADNVVPTILMDEPKEINKNFRNYTLVGKGLCSNIFFGVLKDGCNSAIKKIRHAKVPSVSRFRHENVLPLLGCSVEGHNRVLAYKYSSRGSLDDVLHAYWNVTFPVLSWARRVKIALGAATGLEFLHEKAQPILIHSSIKPSNIFLFDNDVAKIGCPIVSRQAPDINDEWEVLTPRSYYDAPECPLDGEFSMESDVYSFGVVLLELLTGRKDDPTNPTPSNVQALVEWAAPILDGRLDEIKVQQCVDQRIRGDYPPKAVVKMAVIAVRCVQLDKKKRPKMSMVVEALRNISSITEASRCEASSSVAGK